MQSRKATQIATELGTTKNAVLGMVHRLGLSARVVTQVVTTAPKPPLPPSSGSNCAWPIGDPRRPGFYFCGRKDLAPGKPYCVQHAAVAYQRMAKQDG